MAGNHLKRCALMHWSFFLLNDDTKYLVWWVNNRNTDAKKARPKNHVFFKNGWKPSQKMRLDALIILLIEWGHQVSYSWGKQSKYWSHVNVSSIGWGDARSRTVMHGGPGPPCIIHSVMHGGPGPPCIIRVLMHLLLSMYLFSCWSIK